MTRPQETSYEQTKLQVEELVSVLKSVALDNTSGPKQRPLLLIAQNDASSACFELVSSISAEPILPVSGTGRIRGVLVLEASFQGSFTTNTCSDSRKGIDIISEPILISKLDKNQMEAEKLTLK
ncbi:hypothetical protein F53441_11648 [Fusarium austroafricanum]|uniref:Uncharacterized protein n=1 Tax=Fusarium austroafricanum TaxID=2364996 RepID=A0A8H4K2Z5_9HYPO|nr:hypothetical protein F53441_11648 [Fusarium austroafricanum]